MNPVSPFVQSMQVLLDKITSARSDWERQAAEREMAEAIKQQTRREREVRDYKLAQSGERE